MANMLLEVKNLTAGTEDRDILRGVNLDIGRGETHALMGPNGAGKSTLGNVLMGSPTYSVRGGSVTFDGKDLLSLPTNARAKAGLFMTFQAPLEVPGISLENFIRTALEQRTGEKIRIWTFHRRMKEVLGSLEMDASYAMRDLNVGFSGGEKKKAEIIQLMMLEPRLAILDETDSGLDVDAVRTVSKGIAAFQKREDASLLIITHNMGILSSLHVDRVHVLVGGRIVAEGDASLMEEINRDGYGQYETAGQEKRA